MASTQVARPTCRAGVLSCRMRCVPCRTGVRPRKWGIFMDQLTSRNGLSLPGPVRPRKSGFFMDQLASRAGSSTEMGHFYGPTCFPDRFVHGNGAFLWTNLLPGPVRPRKCGVCMDDLTYQPGSSTEMGHFYGPTCFPDRFVHGNGAFSWTNLLPGPVRPRKSAFSW